MLKLNPKTRSAGPALGFDRVGEPYTPRVLESLGVLNAFPDKKDFSPNKPWLHTYRIWGGHGFIKVRNFNIGILLIERLQSESDTVISFRIQQKIVHLGGIVQILTATVTSKNDSIASLVEWNLVSTITDTSGSLSRELNLEHVAKIQDNTIQRTINGQKSTIKLDTPLSSDWTMFEAIQRLPFETPSIPAFDSLDGLTVLKKNHRLFYRNNHSENMTKQNIRLHNFYQLGHGVLPYEYWLDENHRLLMMITGNRNYILDENAEKVFQENVTSLRKGGTYNG